ncbi:MAG: alpha/beta hydrolase fold domain-containing protein, partial [Clostridia bacterium]|nr:alpha/beta hydrolase fold domain-containing protein [Clostridia bacterium]
MLDCNDTESSRHSHSHDWGTRRNHWGWHKYLGELYGTDHVPSYASPARETDYSGLPPCYTFVEDGEPFRDETLTYVQNLKDAGVEAHVDVYHGNIHGFDTMRWTKNAKEARKKLILAVEKFLK